jgi:hypothetical protein
VFISPPLGVGLEREEARRSAKNANVEGPIMGRMVALVFQAPAYA